MRGLLTALLLWCGVAQAFEPSCEPMERTEFELLVAQSLIAIDWDDGDEHRRLVKKIVERLPCLEFVVDPDQWSNLLMGIAIVEFVEGGDWQAPLATALWISPERDRFVGRAHPLARWTAPAVPGKTSVLVPEGIRLYIDGERVTVVPRTPGVHLAQVRTGDGWRNRLLLDRSVPDGWLLAPALAGNSMVRRWSLGVVGLAGRWSQQVVPGGQFLQSAGRIVLDGGVIASLGVQWTPQWQVVMDASVGVSQRGMWERADVGLLLDRTIAVGFGGSLRGLAVQQGQETSTLRVVFPVVLVERLAGEHQRVLAGLRLGGHSALLAGELDIKLRSVGNRDQAGFLVGVNAGALLARLKQEDVSARSISVSALTVGVRVEWGLFR